MRLRVVDIETSGGRPSEIIEIAAVDVVQTGQGWATTEPRSRLFRPRGPISFHAMAVHHLTMADFPESIPVCTPEALGAFLLDGERPDYFVAHNAAFESEHIGPEAIGDLRWICTVKGAKAAWPEAPGYSNQVLRYWRELGLDPALAMPAHRAAPDAWVTAHLLIDMMQTLSVEDLLKATLKPRSLDVIPFGKHRRKPWSEVPGSYLAWMVNQPEMATDVVERARAEMAARAALDPDGSDPGLSSASREL